MEIRTRSWKNLSIINPIIDADGWSKLRDELQEITFVPLLLELTDILGHKG